MNRLFEFGLKIIHGFAVSEAIVSKSSGENLKKDGNTIDSTVVDQKPGRRNVRLFLKCYFLVKCIIIAGF